MGPPAWDRHQEVVAEPLAVAAPGVTSVTGESAVADGERQRPQTQTHPKEVDATARRCPMLRDLENARKLTELLGDDGFVRALTNAEQLVDEVDQTLDRVERIEGEAEAAVQEANEALNDVDHRLAKFDETIRLLEAKIEAGFSIAFFYFALNSYLGGDILLAVGLFVMGLLGASSLVVTILTMPQVRRLREMGRAATGKIDREAE